MDFILGTKIKNSQIFKNDNVIPVTVIKAGPVVVTRVKTKEGDGYEAVQVGFGEKKKINKPLRGQLKDLGNPRHLREFRGSGRAVGDKIDVSVFKEGDTVNVIGTVKGRGFQGVVKRHGFGGGPKTHGQKNRYRAPGSIGSTALQRVAKGRRMAGRMGGNRVTVKNLKVVSIDGANNLLMVKGAVPGHRGGLLQIVKVAKK
ncbi:MAG: 50S ribosomal protein L3 [Parcubacteria group bacterium]|nr:50S ribosomal protein L3 [Parcubacteria group bacterium]